MNITHDNHEEYKRGDTVLISGKQVMKAEDQVGTIINVYSDTVKLAISDGTKWYVSTKYIKHFNINM